MTEYRLVWAECPTAYNRTEVLFVEAVDEKAAEAVATDYIQRNYRCSRFIFKLIEPYTRPVGGRVLEG